MNRLVIVLVVLFGLCGGVGAERASMDYDTPEGMECDVGPVSWYGPKYHGRRTANGERYDQWGITAAHRTLPFNTMVHVLWRRPTEDGSYEERTVTVRINDRGPYICRKSEGKCRILDLSRGAAKELDMFKEGVIIARICWEKKKD